MDDLEKVKNIKLDDREMQQPEARDVIELVAAHLPLKDRLRIAEVSKKWREALLPSPNLWVMGEYTDEMLGFALKLMHIPFPPCKVAAICLDPESLSSFRFFLSKRRHAQPLVLGATKAQNLSELVDTLNAYAPNKIQGLNLGWCPPLPPTWNANVLTKLPSLQSLRFCCDSMQFETGVLTVLTALTRLEASCRSVMLHKNCLPSSLRFLNLSGIWGQDGLQQLFLEGLQNLRRIKLTSLILTSTYGHGNAEEDPTGWGMYECVWELETLQDLQIDHIPDTELSWPKEVSRLTALTKLRLPLLTNYNSSEASISNLPNLRAFALRANAVEGDGLPTGLLELPLLETFGLHGSSSFRVRGPEIWQIEDLMLEINSIIDYDFSQPLSSEPRLKHLTIDGQKWALLCEGLPVVQTDAVNSTLTNLLRFLAPLLIFKSLKFSPSTLSGRLTQCTVGKIVDFVQERPDVEVNLF